ncbi:Toxoplasma gondii family A protein [Toxoplasma gondii p89]|uniref:Toxoplasma gondii family A protein n=2 Tax=Toxoplasma gondii TaxID=5811 RepID=A0A2G8XQH8_TOXGO|nr:Toxoplasma gondii family A protein [Toxoplasma gondii p89]PIL97272.1 Toxoplasma gondii family A protein [Toxoplasma gondii COUG]
MGSHIFRAVYLTLLIGSVLHCGGSEQSETPKTEADFTTTIPKTGLEKDLQQVFTLGPSNTLQVIDETGDADYLPKEGENLREALASPYSVAYRFVNGACDFNETVKFKNAFPGYEEPVWVREGPSSGEGVNSPSGKAVRYTFTNPPAEYLGGGLSFCVQFKTFLASGSQTSTSTAATSGSSASAGGTKPDFSTQPNEQESQSHAPAPEDSPGSPGQSEPSEKPESQQGETGEGEDEDDGDDRPQGDESSPEVRPDIPNVGNPSLPKPPDDSPQVDQSQGSSNPDGGSHHPSAPESPEGEMASGNDVTTEQEGSLTRRLSDAQPEKASFLTIVVHSATWSLAGGMSALLVFLLAAAGTLPSIC